MTPFERHRQNWLSCTRCGLAKVRRQVVIARGTVPARIVLVGEAPGESEDVLGRPFCGPAGKLLDEALDYAATQAGDRFLLYNMALINLVGCIPKDETTNRKRGEPLPAEIEACYPRVLEFFGLCKPQLIVAVGSLAEKKAKAENWVSRAKLISIIHPSAILRMDVSQKGLVFQRVCVQLTDAFRDIGA